MKRILVIYNPRSSRYSDVKKEVLAKVQSLKGCMVGKYEVERTGIEQNVEKLAKIVEDDDLVVAAGGDATGVIAVNAIIQSEKDAVLAVLPYGNFNDLARTLGTRTFEDIFGVSPDQSRLFRTHSRPFDPSGRPPGVVSVRKASFLHAQLLRWSGRAYGPQKTELNQGSCPKVNTSDCRVAKLYPLEITVDGKFVRYATCYVTIGMTAEAVKLYDRAKMRKALKSKWGRYVGSYTNLTKWYFKNRHKYEFLPEFRLNGVLQPEGTSDYAAVNGKSMARVMKGGDDWCKPRAFRSETDRLTKFWRLLKLMVRSILVQIPGTGTVGDELEFTKPAKVEMQAEGESLVLEGVKKIEIRKAGKWLRVVKIW